MIDFKKEPAFDLCHNHGFAKEYTYLAWDLAKKDPTGLPIPYAVECHEREDWEKGHPDNYYLNMHEEHSFYEYWPETARWALVDTSDRGCVLECAQGTIEIPVADPGVSPEDLMLVDGLPALYVLGWRLSSPNRFVIGHCLWDHVWRGGKILYRLHNLPYPERQATLTEWPAGMQFAPLNDFLGVGPNDEKAK